MYLLLNKMSAASRNKSVIPGLPGLLTQTKRDNG